MPNNVLHWKRRGGFFTEKRQENVNIRARRMEKGASPPMAIRCSQSVKRKRSR